MFPMKRGLPLVGHATASPVMNVLDPEVKALPAPIAIESSEVAPK